MRLQLWISRDNGGGMQLQQQVKDTRTESVPTGGAWKTLTTAVLFERWELVQNQTRLTWVSPPYYFVSVVIDKGYPTHTTLFRCVWTACLCWLEEWQPMDSYEGSRVMAKLNYAHAICQWWLYHCFCLLTPSSVIMWLFWHDSSYVYGLYVHIPAYTCTVATWLLLDGRVSGYHELWTLNNVQSHRSETNFEKGASNRNSPPGMQEHFRLAFWISILMYVYWKCRCICTRTVFAFCFVLQALQGLAINKIPNIEWFCSTVYTSTPPRLPPPIFRGSGSETSLVPRLRPRSWAWERG